MSGNASVLTGLASLLVVASLAAWKGGPAERISAGMIFATWLAPVLAQIGFGVDLPVYVFMIADGLLAFGLLVLAIRFSSMWLGGAMLVQSCTFALHSIVLEQGQLAAGVYVFLVNTLSYVVLLLLLGATFSAWSARQKRRRGGGSAADSADAGLTSLAL